MRTEYRLWHKSNPNHAYEEMELYPNWEAAAMTTNVEGLGPWNVGGDSDKLWAETGHDQWLITPERVPESVDDRVELAIDTALDFDGYDGAQHKQWVIDRMLRYLAGDRYADLVPSDWDEGVAP